MSKNDITGDWIVSKPNSKQFDQNFDKIFRSHLKDNKDLHKDLAEYELDKSTGEVTRVTK